MGISSFVGERVKQVKVMDAPISVSDYMAKKVIYFSPDDNIMNVMSVLAKHKITGGPVVKDGKLVGIISESDCMKTLSDNRYFNIPMGSETVEKYMSEVQATIDANASIFEAAERFHNTPYKRFPVLENGKLVGQISQHDVIRAALKLNSQNWGY